MMRLYRSMRVYCEYRECEQVLKAKCCEYREYQSTSIMGHPDAWSISGRIRSEESRNTTAAVILRVLAVSEV